MAAGYVWDPAYVGHIDMNQLKEFFQKLAILSSKTNEYKSCVQTQQLAT